MITISSSLAQERNLGRPVAPQFFAIVAAKPSRGATIFFGICLHPMETKKFSGVRNATSPPSSNPICFATMLWFIYEGDANLYRDVKSLSAKSLPPCSTCRQRQIRRQRKQLHWRRDFRLRPNPSNESYDPWKRRKRRNVRKEGFSVT